MPQELAHRDAAVSSCIAEKHNVARQRSSRGDLFEQDVELSVLRHVVEDGRVEAGEVFQQVALWVLQLAAVLADN